jgi:hypothetical protein
LGLLLRSGRIKTGGQSDTTDLSGDLEIEDISKGILFHKQA